MATYWCGKMMGFASLYPSYDTTTRLLRLRERAQDPRPGADALVIALEIVLLVRRMDVVVVEAEADQHGVEAERALEIRDDRDRGTGADQKRFLAPLVRQRALGGSQRLHVPVERDCRRVGVVGELGLAIGGHARGDIVAESLADFRGILSLHQAERNFCGSFRRDHGLRTLAGIAADDNVDVAGRARGHLFDQETVLLAGRN